MELNLFTFSCFENCSRQYICEKITRIETRLVYSTCIWGLFSSDDNNSERSTQVEEREKFSAVPALEKQVFLSGYAEVTCFRVKTVKN